MLPIGFVFAFWAYRVFGRFSVEGGVKNTTENLLFKNKLNPRNLTSGFPRFVLLRFWLFLGKGNSKTPGNVL
jgi:hypothetical protein